MNTVDEVLTRRVDKILPSKNGLIKLLQERKIRLYQGFDATAGKLHLGHSVGIRKLMDFANAGHEVIFLFGTGTVLVGDPSQRETGRKLISLEEVEKNIQGWKGQVSSIVDWDKVKILKNGDWLRELKLEDIVKIASNISAVQLFKREMFQRRLDAGDTVWYHETMYPLLQGFDSVVLDVDLEIGGTDQEFNMLIGRELMRKMKGKEKFVLTTPMILGTDGKQMSKSSGNCVWLDDTPDDMYGKLMSIPDTQIISYMENVTAIALEKVREAEKDLKSGKLNPIDAKKELAFAVVTELHSKLEAEKAQEYFEKTFQKGKPQYKQSVIIQKNLSYTVAQVVKSTSEAKRFIKQGAVDVNEETIKNPSQQINVGDNIKVGEKIFLKVTDK